MIPPSTITIQGFIPVVNDTTLPGYIDRYVDLVNHLIWTRLLSMTLKRQIQQPR